MHHVNNTTNFIADELSRPRIEGPCVVKSPTSLPRVHDCGSDCVTRDLKLRRHSLQTTTSCSLSRPNQYLLLDVQIFPGVELAHPVGVSQVQQLHIHGRFRHIKFIVSSIQLYFP